MGRPNKPRYREDKGTWVSKIDGRLRTLAKGRRNRPEAMRVLAEILAKRAAPAPSPLDDVTLVALFDHFLDHAKVNLAVETYRWYRRHLALAVEALGRNAPSQSVRPIDVTHWVDGPHDKPAWRDGESYRVACEWSRSTKHGAIASVKAAYSWAVRQGLAASNPLAGMPSPGIDQRTAMIDAATARKVLDILEGDSLADILEFLHETGCRPSEAYRLEAVHLDFDVGIAVLPGKTTRRTNKPRVVYLTKRAADIAKSAARAHPEGPIFRNRRGLPWTPNAVGSRLGKIRKKHGLSADVIPEAFRHGWVTDALIRGVPDKIVAEIAGHQSTAMIHKHYAHLARRAREIRGHAESVRRDPKGDGDSTPSS